MSFFHSLANEQRGLRKTQKKAETVAPVSAFLSLAVVTEDVRYRQSRTDLRNDPDLAHGGP